MQYSQVRFPTGPGMNDAAQKNPIVAHNIMRQITDNQKISVSTFTIAIKTKMSIYYESCSACSLLQDDHNSAYE